MYIGISVYSTTLVLNEIKVILINREKKKLFQNTEEIPRLKILRIHNQKAYICSSAGEHYRISLKNMTQSKL